MKRDIVTIHLDGESLKFDREKLIGICEGKGFAAIRREESPHQYFQASEFLKREKNEQDLYRSGRPDHKDGMGSRNPRHRHSRETGPETKQH